MTNTTSLDRRQFLRQSMVAVAGVAATGLGGCCACFKKKSPKPVFKISLAEWSLHRALRDRPTMNNLDFPVIARQAYGIDAVEFVNQFFKDKANDQGYLTELKSRCDGEGVRSVLIMCDGEGNLGDADEARRKQAVENHYKWVGAAKFLGCHSIRVNAATGNVGSFEEQQRRAADGLHRLASYASQSGLNVLVENHGGLSSNGAWLAGVMNQVNLPNCGTLPDFGNFNIDGNQTYDRYQGVTEMMPYAKAVSAKSYAFDADGNETTIDFMKIMRLVLAAGYRNWVGIEYEGNSLSEPDGIRATHQLLMRVREQLQTQFA